MLSTGAPSESKQHNPLELYGIAVAATPNEEHLGYDLHCNTIGVSSYRNFRVLEDLSFKQRFRLPEDDDSSLRDAYIRLTDVFDNVVLKQKDALEAHEQAANVQKAVFEARGYDNAPVSCILGQDGRNPAFFEAIFFELFAEGFSEPPPNIFYGKVPPKGWYIAEIMKDHAFLNAIRKMVTAAKSCAFYPGTFTKSNDEPTSNSADVKQTDWDRYLISLRRKVFQQCGSDGFSKVKDSVPSLHKAIIRAAKLRGRDIGKCLNENFHSFAEEAPKGYRESLSEQARLPSLSFDTWHPDYRAAVFRGIAQVYDGKAGFRRYKLAMDPPGEFFTHPTADLVREKRQVLKGERDNFNHDERIRKSILFTGERVLAAVERVHGKMSPPASLMMNRSGSTLKD